MARGREALEDGCKGTIALFATGARLVIADGKDAITLDGTARVTFEIDRCVRHDPMLRKRGPEIITAMRFPNVVTIGGEPRL